MDMDKGQDLSYHIRDQTFQLKQTVSLPADSARHIPTNYPYDNHLFLSLNLEVPQHKVPSIK